ncbi:group II intron maturase-specific domain-containing protein [Rhizobium jaguaris]|uniref:group II intron maturase-specific domain-containing protein n=1 Tax=Rhizobium jaguaris TaxID=1312183 RepID=UPI001FE0EACD|nr:group II intron maturase-specific domain-containing protein [Rhizobium jaguaris]
MIKSLNIPRQTPGTLAEIAKQLNPLLRGWIPYYGRFSGPGRDDGYPSPPGQFRTCGTTAYGSYRL